MNQYCKKKLGILLGIIGIALISILFFMWQEPSDTMEVVNPNNAIVEPDPSSRGITNFEECVQAGNPVMESYPRQCTTIDGKNFREDIEQDVCIVTGCSSHVCSREQVDTTCEFKEEYACYREALCEVQADGECGWTMTEDLQQCLDQAIMNGQSIEQEVTLQDVIEEPNEKEAISENAIVKRYISWGYENASHRAIDTIILHSSYNSLGGDQYDVEKIVDIYRQYGVGAHYIIDRGGVAHQLVREKDIAYHAGVSSLPDGRKNVNQVSIGIEIINHTDDDMTSAQYNTLNFLIGSMEEKYILKYILGHDDIAPERKTDPWNLDWKKINR